MYGIHVRKNDTTLAEQIVIERQYCTAMQIYTHGPKSYNRNKIDGVQEAAKDITLFVHSTYFSLPWKGKTSAINHIIDQLNTVAEIDVNGNTRGLVVHLPKDKPEVIVDAMKKFKHTVPIILEMTSVKSDPERTYETPEKLNKLCSLLGDINYGICIDTSHIWAAGEDVRTKAYLDNWFSRLKYPNKIHLIHLNGSSNDMGSGKDTHIVPFTETDKIWHGIEYNNSGVKSVIEFCKKYKVPVIMEINRGDKNEILKMKKLLQKKFKNIK